MIIAIIYFACALISAVVSIVDYTQHRKTWIIPATLAVSGLILGAVTAIKTI